MPKKTDKNNTFKNFQATIKEVISFEGIGIHTGSNNKIIINPAPPDSGIIFQNSNHKMPASVDFVDTTVHGVTLRNGDMEIKNCEHILSTLYGLGITNALIEIEGKEIPAMDGSTKDFAAKIKADYQGVERKVLKPSEPIYIRHQDSAIFLIPDDEFKISSFIEYKHPGLGPQFKHLTITPEVYLTELCSARTYTFTGWIDDLRARGLIQGGSVENALIINEKGALNGLRFSDEPVRHKILDMIGDIALIGVDIKGWIIGIKPGHSLNCAFVRRLKCFLT